MGLQAKDSKHYVVELNLIAVVTVVTVAHTLNDI
jgi:hypothetical protein